MPTPNTSIFWSGPVTSFQLQKYSLESEALATYFTLAGVEITYDCDFLRIETDQFLGFTHIKKVMHNFRIKATIPEYSMVNGKWSLSQTASNIAGLQMWITNEDRGYVSVQIEAGGISGMVDIWKFYRCALLANGVIRYANGEQTGWVMEFEALPDPLNSNRLGYIIEQGV